MIRAFLAAALCLLLAATPAAAVTYDTWDTDSLFTDGTGVTFSGGNLVAQGAISNYTTVQTLEGKTSGKWYVEVVRANGSSTTDGCGVGNSWNHNAASGNNYYGASGTTMPSNDQGWEYFTNGAGVFNHGSSQTAVNDPSYANGDTISYAIDLTNKKFWIRKNNGSWGGSSGTPNPATNTGGFDISNLLSNNGRVYFQCDMQSNSSATKWTANFGATTFTETVPSGFGGWTNTTAGTYFGTLGGSKGSNQALSSNAGVITGDKIVSVYTATITGSVTSIVIPFSGNAGTVSNLKGVIYDATGVAGLPGALLGVSSNTITSGSYGEQTFSFSGVSVVASTNYWFGWVSSATNSTTVNQINMITFSSGVYTAYNSGTYSSPSNPFGALPSHLTFRMPIIINVTPASTSVARHKLIENFLPSAAENHNDMALRK